MAVWTIAVNNVKRTLGNVALVPILIVLPVLQMLLVNSIAGGAVSQASLPAAPDPVFETILLDKAPILAPVQLFAAGILVQFLLIAGMIAAIMIISQRENKTLMREFTCPVSRAQIITGNLAGQCMTVLVIAVVFIGITSVAMGVDWGNLSGVILVSLFVVYCSVSLAFLASAIFKRAKIAGAMMSFFLTAMTFLSDSINFNGNFSATSGFTLNKWGYEAYNKLMEGRGLDAIFPNFAVLGIAGTAFLVTAIILYRREGIYE